MKNALSRRGRKQLKRLCASMQSNTNQKLFKSLSDLSSGIEGIDLPIPNNPGSVLKTSYDEDSFTAEVKTAQGHVINKFETFYIEDNDYDEPLYDVYVNNNTEEEGVEADTVSDFFGEWLTDLRHLVGVVDEETEWRLQNSGTVSQESSLSRSLLATEYMQEVLNLESPTDNEDPLDMLYYLTEESYDWFLNEYIVPVLKQIALRVEDNYTNLIKIRDFDFESGGFDRSELNIYYRVMDDIDEVFDYYQFGDRFIDTLQDIVAIPKKERTARTIERAMDDFVMLAVASMEDDLDWEFSNSINNYLNSNVNTSKVMFEVETSKEVESTLQLNFKIVGDNELQRQVQELTGSARNEVEVDVDALLTAGGNAMQKQLAEFINRNWVVVKATAYCVPVYDRLYCVGSLVLQLQRRLGRLR